MSQRPDTFMRADPFPITDLADTIYRTCENGTSEVHDTFERGVTSILSSGELQGKDVNAYRDNLLPAITRAITNGLQAMQAVHKVLCSPSAPECRSRAPEGYAGYTGYLRQRDERIQQWTTQLDNRHESIVNTILGGAGMIMGDGPVMQQAAPGLDNALRPGDTEYFEPLLRGEADFNWYYGLISLGGSLYDDVFAAAYDDLTTVEQAYAAQMQVQVGAELSPSAPNGWGMVQFAITQSGAGITPFGGLGGGLPAANLPSLDNPPLPQPGSGGGGSGNGSGGGAGSGLGGIPGGGPGLGGVPAFPPPALAATWGDTRPDQFPEPQNVEDLAREIIRRQGGRHHLLLITHFGPADQNNWLVTIPDQGNANYIQDPGDPGSGTSQGAGSSLGSGLPSVNAALPTNSGSATPASSAMPDDGTTYSAPYDAANSASSATPDLYLNDSQAVKLELGGTLSPYGQFVGQAIQQYCTSQPADPSGAMANGVATQATATPAADPALAGGAGGLIGQMIAQGINASSAVIKLTCPPTSPQHPASIWLAGQGLGGMVAQNLAAKKPFPGDNPNLSPAHIIKGVVAFGAPIVGNYVPGISYNFFQIKGDRVGDIPVDTVGVHDERMRDVHDLPNPFLTPPWQSSDPKKPDYVKDPHDPSIVHNGYADSPLLQKLKLPFDGLMRSGGWGPTYVISIPMSPASTGMAGSTQVPGADATAGIAMPGTSTGAGG